MRKFKIYSGILLMIIINGNLHAQCNLITSPSVGVVSCGSETTISALGLMTTPQFSANFNSGTLGTGLSSSSSIDYGNPCGPSIDGTPSAWFGSGPAPRRLTTIGLDLSCGAQICFDFDFANNDSCSGCNSCDGPNLWNEGVYFEYSIDNGANWINIFYFQPDSSYSSQHYNWSNYCFILPTQALSSNTMLRWNQPNISSNLGDHWGIDNIVITASDCNFWYDWAHVPGFPDNNSITVSTNNTSTYYVTYTDGNAVCLDSVVLNIVPLEIEIVGTPNPIDCDSCANLSVDFTNYTNGTIDDNFDTGFDPANWGDIQSGTISSICGGGATGNTLYFDGIGTNRFAETVAIDATNCGKIDFCLFMGNTLSGGGTCENNELGDDIVLEYSIDNGLTFVPIATYLESLWDNLNTQQCFSITMPLFAQTQSTIFRWRQVAFMAANGSDNWSLDNVNISCSPSSIAYNWTSGLVDDAASANPIGCPIQDELYTVSITNSLSNCVATDTTTLFVNDCICAFSQFDGQLISQQSGGLADVNGMFEYTHSPLTGAIIVEATNNSGTYSQTFNPPFTNNMINNYSITGIPDDGSIISMSIHFSDLISCIDTFQITSNLSIHKIVNLMNECDVTPNPVNNEAELVFNNQNKEKLTVTIVNEKGQILYNKTTTESSITIKGTEFTLGQYYYTVKSLGNYKKCSGKFVVTF